MIGIYAVCDFIFFRRKKEEKKVFAFSVVFYLLTRATVLDVSNKKFFSFKDVTKDYTFDAVELSECRSKELIIFF